jgi:hypothetical protein
MSMGREGVRLLRRVLALAAVLGATAGTLWAVDEVARAAGEPAAGRAFASVAEAERRLRARLSLPAYFPARLRWPPARVVGTARGGGAVVLAVEAQGGGEELLIGQTLEGVGALPGALWPEGVSLETSPTFACGEQARAGTAGRVHAADGSVWREVSCEVHGRRVVLRSRGPAAELMQMAASLRREGPGRP